MHQSIKFTTLQAPNQENIIKELSGYVARKLGINSEFIIDIPWQERERLLDLGEIDIAWICGLPYVRKVDNPPPRLELLAAPVMDGERYLNKPIYFSDVIARKQSRYLSFEDLRGARWAYNEPGSQSGYNITRYHLSCIGEYTGFFGSVVSAGSHAKSIEMVRNGEIDAAAIDSTVLEIELIQNPGLSQEIRIIDCLGPSPIPPLVISTMVDASLRSDIRQIITNMHSYHEGNQILSRGNVKRYTSVSDDDYNPIREMVRAAENVKFEQE